MRGFPLLALAQCTTLDSEKPNNSRHASGHWSSRSSRRRSPLEVASCRSTWPDAIATQVFAVDLSLSERLRFALVSASEAKNRVEPKRSVTDHADFLQSITGLCGSTGGSRLRGRCWLISLGSGHERN